MSTVCSLNDLRILDIYSLQTAITPTVLDALNIFYGREMSIWALTETQLYNIWSTVEKLQLRLRRQSWGLRPQISGWGSRGLHEMLLYPIMYGNMRREHFLQR